MSSESLAPRQDIQGLRALAVLAVVLYHAKLPLFAGGYVGVDVFFVVSGYLISGSLLREIEHSGRLDILEFYARRIRRLLPAAILVLVTVALWARVSLAPVEQRELAPAILSAAIYVSNIWFFTQATDYLAGDIHTNPVLHMWSLAVEEQFYLVWPFLVLLGVRWQSLKGTRLRGITSMMCAVGLASFALSIWLYGVSTPAAFFLSPARAWEFAAGGLTYLLCQRYRAVLARLSGVLAGIGLLLIAAAVAGFDDATAFPSWSALLPVLGTVLMIASGSSGMPAPLIWMRAAPIQTTGNISYSWYLWHWPVLVFPAIGGTLSVIERLALVALSCALAWLTWRFVENPFRYRWRWWRLPWRTLTMGVIFTACSTSAALALRASAKASEQLPLQRKLFLIRQAMPEMHGSACHADTAGIAIAECAFGETASSRTVFLAGDSHAAHWFTGIRAAVGRRGMRLVSLTKSACPVATVMPMLVSHGRRYDECEQWREAVLERIARERPALVVVSHSSKYLADPKLGIDAEAWKRGMQRTLYRLSASARLVAVLQDTPWPGFDVPICLSRAYWRGASEAACRFSRESIDGGAMAVLDRAVAATFPNVVFVDTQPLLCPGLLCEAVVEGEVAYADSHHISTALSARLGDRLMQPLFERLGWGD